MVSWRLFAGRNLPLLALGCFVAFALVTALVVILQPQRLDLPITREVQEVQFAPLGWLLTAVSWPGYPPYNFIFPALAILLLLALRQTAAAGFLALASVASVASAIVKALVQRGRPSADLVTVIGNPLGYSFPSGHVTQYTLFFGFGFYLAWTLLKPGPQRTGLLLFCAAMIILVGPSRIWLGAHWASDVFGGYTLGFGLLLLILWTYRGWLKRTAEMKGAH